MNAISVCSSALISYYILCVCARPHLIHRKEKKLICLLQDFITDFRIGLESLISSFISRNQRRAPHIYIVISIHSADVCLTFCSDRNIFENVFKGPPVKKNFKYLYLCMYWLAKMRKYKFLSYSHSLYAYIRVLCALYFTYNRCSR